MTGQKRAVVPEIRPGIVEVTTEVLDDLLTQTGWKLVGIEGDKRFYDKTFAAPDAPPPPAPDGGVAMINRTAYASQHGESFRTARRISCAGCTCDEGTTCDTRKVCTGCEGSKTYCDANRSVVGDPCCAACRHDG